MSERTFDPIGFPVDDEVYEAFTEYEDKTADRPWSFLYGAHPRDWHQAYQLFAAGYQAGEQSKMALVLQQREQLARLLVP